MNENELNANTTINGPRHYSTSLIAGGVAGTIVDVTLFPLDTLKTRLQSQFGFIQSGGFRGIYKGLTPTIIGAPFSAGLFFGAYDGFKNLFPNVSNNAAPIVHICAGIFAEVICCTTKVPIEIVKQRRQASLNQESISIIIKNAYAYEGVFGFYRGYWTTVMRDVPFSMLQFPIWEYLKKEYTIFTGKPLTSLEVALCGSISGGIAAALTTPIDVTKTQIMLANSASDKNFSTVLIGIYKTKGISGLFAGFLPRIGFIMIGGALFFGTYEKICKIIENKLKHSLFLKFTDDNPFLNTLYLRKYNKILNYLYTYLLLLSSKLASFDENNEFECKKRKKHKRDKFEDKEKSGGLKLILKVGSGSCLPADDTVNNGNLEVGDYLSKSHKKKKKKHKHHKEKKKRIRDDITMHEEMSLGEETLAEAPIPKRSIGFENSNKVTTNLNKSQNGDWVSDEISNPNENRQTLQELLMHLLRALERRDPQNLFAWPVTDRIAPNYSRLITKPMDFDTIKRNIQSNQYTSLNAFIVDFKLMCENAMTYNQPETIYYKAAKRLLHAGLKLTGPEKLKTLLSAMPGMANIPTSQLGFDINQDYQGDTSNDTIITENNERLNDNEQSNQRKILSKFEAIPDNLAPDEILKQAQNAAKIASEKLATKITKMGFLKQQNNGSTSLSILVPNDGINPETGERPVLLGSLIGKLNHGVGSIPGFREDRRNMVKTVKPLYYGAFGSYAPTYDSTFANLTKDESDLVLKTYGDEASAQYAESILNFTKDSDYAMTMADNLLDLMTGGDHRKTKRMLDERKKQVILDDIKKPNSQLQQPSSCQTSQANIGSSNNTTANGQTKSTPIQIDQLKSLSELGIDTKFIDYYQEQSVFQDRLDQVGGLLGRLQNVQNQRLSAPLPPHLSHISHPSPQEIQLADKITESLAENLKRVPPSAVMSVTGVRKAMGVAQVSHLDASQNNCHSSNLVNHGSSHQQTQVSLIGEGIQDRVETVEGTVSGVDLESELREFLESDPTLTSFPLHDENDRTIEEILSES